MDDNYSTVGDLDNPQPLTVVMTSDEHATLVRQLSSARDWAAWLESENMRLIGLLGADVSDLEAML